jgi:hypothetical protein
VSAWLPAAALEEGGSEAAAAGGAWARLPAARLQQNAGRCCAEGFFNALSWLFALLHQYRWLLGPCRMVDVWLSTPLGEEPDLIVRSMQVGGCRWAERVQRRREALVARAATAARDLQQATEGLLPSLSTEHHPLTWRSLQRTHASLSAGDPSTVLQCGGRRGHCSAAAVRQGAHWAGRGCAVAWQLPAKLFSTRCASPAACHQPVRLPADRFSNLCSVELHKDLFCFVKERCSEDQLAGGLKWPARRGHVA